MRSLPTVSTVVNTNGLLEQENTVEITTDPTVIEEVTTTEQLITTEIPAAQVIQEMHVPKPQPVALMKINKIGKENNLPTMTMLKHTVHCAKKSCHRASNLCF